MPRDHAVRCGPAKAHHIVRLGALALLRKRHVPSLPFNDIREARAVTGFCGTQETRASIILL